MEAIVADSASSEPPTMIMSLIDLLMLNAIVCGLEFCASAAFCYIPPLLLKHGIRCEIFFVLDLIYSETVAQHYSFLVKSQIMQINSFFKRAFKYGYVESIISVEELLKSYDDRLFYSATCDNHCLHHLLPVAKSINYALQDVGHGLSIEHVQSELHKRTFINRMIFSNCY